MKLHLKGTRLVTIHSRIWLMFSFQDIRMVALAYGHGHSYADTLLDTSMILCMDLGMISSHPAPSEAHSCIRCPAYSQRSLPHTLQ